LISTQINQARKQKLVKLIDEHDKFIGKLHTVKFAIIVKHLKLKFIVFWLIVMLTYTEFIISSFIVDPFYLVYAAQIEIANHLIHMQCFRFYIYMCGIERRIEVISRCNFDNDGELMRALMEFYGVWREFYELYGINLMICMMQLYLVITINLFWLGMSMIGVRNAIMLGEIFYILYDMNLHLIF
jgi:hypothetical protein